MEVELTEDRHEEWIENYLRRRFPALEAEYRAAYAAFRQMLASGKPDPAGLALIERAATSRYSVLWDNASHWLAHLTLKFPEPYEILRRMSHARDANVRFAALCGLGSRAPREILVDAILRGITDGNSKVRWKAIEKARQHEVKEAIPLIERQREVEKVRKVIDVIDFELPMLRDGYLCKRGYSEGEFNLTVGGLGGVVTRSLSQGEIEREGGIEAIARRWKAEMDGDVIRFKYA